MNRPLKFLLGIGLGASIAFGASTGALAAYIGDNTSGATAARDSRIAVWSSGTNSRLIYVNEMLYPDTADDATAACLGDICLVP